MKTIEDIREEYDWKEAFGYADFSMDDVAEVLHLQEGENDGDSWLFIARLNDGRFGHFEAWCDYTGWDCQAGGDSGIFGTFEELQRFGLTKAARARLGLVLPDLDSTPTQYGKAP